MISLSKKSHFGPRYEGDHSTKKWNLLTNQKFKGPSSNIKMEEKVSGKCRLKSRLVSSPPSIDNNNENHFVIFTGATFALVTHV